MKNPLKNQSGESLTLPAMSSGGLLLLPVWPKTHLAVSYYGVKAHIPRQVFGAVVDGRLYYGANWLCDGHADRIVLLADPVDHPTCENCLSKSRPVVYRMFGIDRQLLYIGSTCLPRNRFRQHQQEQSWWPEVVKIETTSYDSMPAARLAEYQAILAEHPRYNRQRAVNRQGCVSRSDAA